MYFFLLHLDTCMHGLYLLTDNTTVVTWSWGTVFSERLVVWGYTQEKKKRDLRYSILIIKVMIVIIKVSRIQALPPPPQNNKKQTAPSDYYKSVINLKSNVKWLSDYRLIKYPMRGKKEKKNGWLEDFWFISMNNFFFFQTLPENTGSFSSWTVVIRLKNFLIFTMKHLGIMILLTNRNILFCFLFFNSRSSQKLLKLWVHL